MWSPTRPLDARLDTSRDPIPGAERNTVLRSLDWILRGVGQVVFQGNWLSGIVILVGIGVTSRVYLVAAIVLDGIFLAHAWRVWRAYTDEAARKSFRWSILYLALLFAALLVDHALA